MDKNSIKLKPVSSKPEKFNKVIANKLNEHAKEKYFPFDWKDLNLEARNKQSQLVGGLAGGTIWNWLFVRALWVAKKYRNQGLGTQLLQKAQLMAKKRGCSYIELDTYSYQAPGFYRKLGFKRFGTLKPFPKGARRYYLFKKIGSK